MRAIDHLATTPWIHDHALSKRVVDAVSGGVVRFINGEILTLAESRRLVGVEYLKTLPYVDAERIGSDGKSFGGFLTLYALIHAPDVFRCGVAGSGPTDWSYYDTIYTERYMNTPAANPEGYAASELVSRAGDIGAAPLIIHGLADTNVHLKNSVAFIQALEKADKPFLFVPLPGEDHHYEGDGLATALSQSTAYSGGRWGNNSPRRNIRRPREVTAMSEGIGDRYLRETKYHPERMLGRDLDWAAKPSAYKEYPSSRRVELPAPVPRREADLHRVLLARSSVRDYSGEPLSLADLSYLLWACAGIRRVAQGYAFRTSPSAGALYPIETYAVANNVRGLEPGLYHYAVRAHALEELRLGDLRLETARAALYQGICADAAAVLVWTAVFERSKWKYEQRGYRYVFMDAGHMCENLYLVATGQGLGVCAVGALFDDELNALLGVDGVEESAIYMAAVGHPLRKGKE